MMRTSKLLLGVTAIAIISVAALWGSGNRPDRLVQVVQKQDSAKPSPAAERMIAAAQKLLAGMSDPLRKQAAFDFDDPARLQWHYYPITPWPRHGAVFKAMTAKERDLFKGLLRAATSDHGFKSVENVMALDNILRDIENTEWAKKFRDSELYHVCIFGKPVATGTWGFRIEGHHLNLNYVIDNGRIGASTPSVWGANPATVLSGPHQNLRALGREEDLARRLYTELAPSARKTATLAEQGPFDVLTEVKARPKSLPLEGVAFRDLNARQQDLIRELLRAYAGKHPAEVAERMMDEALGDNNASRIHFGWAGSPYPGEPHYYRLQGPRFVIEFCNTQNQGNHVHAVWRSYTNDFGLAATR